MFAQVNSEHCRHKTFNAAWTIDGERQSRTLFEMIRNTYAKSPGGVLSAYSDNAAVIRGADGRSVLPERRHEDLRVPRQKRFIRR